MNYRTLPILGIALLPIAVLAQSSNYSPPSQSTSVLQGLPFNQAVPIDETYRQEFDRCDRSNIFKGRAMVGFRKCSTDPNNVKALLKFPDGTVFFESKLSLDVDGSWLACKGSGAPTSQCPTSFNWPNISQRPNQFIDPDNYPYIVIPNFNSVSGTADREFSNKTGINLGDVGVVIYKDKVIPVFVADGGPYNKLGEGSSALFKLMGEDRCRNWRTDGKTRPDKKWTSDLYCTNYRESSVPGKVLFFIFPRSKIADITPSNAVNKVNIEALNRFQNLQVNSRIFLKVDQPTSGQIVSVNTPVTFSGTAEPEVEVIKVSIGPGGLFAIADLNNVGATWSFTQTFRNRGVDRPVTVQAFDTSGNRLQSFLFTITVK